MGNKELGDFLRSRRRRLDPAAIGVSVMRRRRTPGLRREEVAERAGISCEWYVKLEQGRDVSASPQTVAALARALTLDAAETEHLRQLADRSAPPAFVREAVPDIVAAIVRELPQLAYVTGARWDVLTWNAAAEELFGFGRMDERDRNILTYMFTDASARALFADDWAPEAKRMLALFRATHDQRAGDPAFETLIQGLSDASGDFRSWWCSHDVRAPSAGTKTLHPASREPATFAYASFQSNDDPALKLALYVREGASERA